MFYFVSPNASGGAGFRLGARSDGRDWRISGLRPNFVRDLLAVATAGMTPRAGSAGCCYQQEKPGRSPHTVGLCCPNLTHYARNSQSRRVLNQDESMAIELSSMGALSHCGSQHRGRRNIIFLWDHPASGEAARPVGVNALATAEVELGENGSILPRPKALT